MSAEFESEIPKTVDYVGELCGQWEEVGRESVRWIQEAWDRTNFCDHGNEHHDHLNNCQFLVKNHAECGTVVVTSPDNKSRLDAKNCFVNNTRATRELKYLTCGT